MKRMGKLFLYGGLSLVLCACGTENTENIMPTPTTQVTKIPDETSQLISGKPEEELCDAFIDWTELECVVDEETSRCNSNLLNYGCLTYDAEGNIYFVDRNSDKIYVSGARGENKRLLCEAKDVFGWLQVAENWLYYGTDRTAIMRVHIETGEVEQISQELSGDFLISKEKIYRNDRNQDGFSSFELDGSNKEVVVDTSAFYIGNYVQGTDFWLTEGDIKETKSREDYIIKLSKGKKEILKQEGYFVLLAGKYVSMIDAGTNARYIRDMETKEVTNLGVQTDQTVVSDGNNFYYKDMKFSDSEDENGLFAQEKAHIMKWNGKSSEEIWVINTDNLYEMYLTPNMLYCMPQMQLNGAGGYHLLYYDLETGETGIIY